MTEAVSGGEVKQTLWCNEQSVRGDQGVGDDGRGGQGNEEGLLGGVTDFVFRGNCNGTPQVFIGLMLDAMAPEMHLQSSEHQYLAA